MNITKIIRGVRVPAAGLFRNYSNDVNPLSRTVRVVTNGIAEFFGMNKTASVYPTHADIVIIGGGYIGSAVAHALKTRAGEGLSVIVLEKDLTYREVRNNISHGTLIRNCSLPENIELASYGAEFLRKARENLGEDVDVQYTPYGFLMLASERYTEKLEQTAVQQREMGLKNEILSANEIQERFPWINTSDIKLVLARLNHAWACYNDSQSSLLYWHNLILFLDSPELRSVATTAFCDSPRLHGSKHSTSEIDSDSKIGTLVRMCVYSPAHCLILQARKACLSAGSMCLETEGVFNSWAFLSGLIRKSQDLGAIYINAEVTGFEIEKQRDVLMEGVEPGSFERICKVLYKTPDNEEHSIKFAACILAAGNKSGEIAKLAKIGNSDGLLSLPLPIEKRGYGIYAICDEDRMTHLNTPLIMDTSGVWLRKDGLTNNLLCGHVPFTSEESKNMSEEEFLKKIIEPSVNNRFPLTIGKKLKKLTTEMQDYNTYDETGIIGPHPYHNNLYIAAGFGKYGCQHAPGIGRAITELIIDSHYTTIDLTRFSFDRIFINEPLIEFDVY
ncbi:FAD-dependent oxidoreductase domain-containing protein 1 isoform X1 [Amyelois transitella]|uniref:FAD-dependent oxidoreductase domain-containing protein 1 isoform X1 n=1 Tax=Amyelois transitella TaxID=680683 RepID=UPI00299014CF|nr:FAD-dependent oxidoreductase domain-containing protein 1 isoform X1 [Amyelois transitella]